MYQYPYVSIKRKEITHNISVILSKCLEKSVKVTGVIKGVNGHQEIAQIFMENGCESIGSSRITHLKNLKREGFECNMWLLRIPMLSEVSELIKYVDISLNSEAEVLEAINTACLMHKKIHKVVLMIELGDLREGVLEIDELMKMVDKIETE